MPASKRSREANARQRRARQRRLAEQARVEAVAQDALQLLEAQRAADQLADRQRQARGERALTDAPVREVSAGLPGHGKRR